MGCIMKEWYGLYDEIGQLLQLKEFDYEPSVGDFNCSWDSRSEYTIKLMKVNPVVN